MGEGSWVAQGTQWCPPLFGRLFPSVLVPGRVLGKDKLSAGVYLKAGVVFQLFSSPTWLCLAASWSAGRHAQSGLQRAAFTFPHFTGPRPGLYLERNGPVCHLSANVILALRRSQHPFWPL